MACCPTTMTAPTTLTTPTPALYLTILTFNTGVLNPLSLPQRPQRPQPPPAPSPSMLAPLSVPTPPRPTPPRAWHTSGARPGWQPCTSQPATLHPGTLSPSATTTETQESPGHGHLNHTPLMPSSTNAQQQNPQPFPTPPSSQLSPYTLTQQPPPLPHLPEAVNLRPLSTDCPYLHRLDGHQNTTAISIGSRGVTPSWPTSTVSPATCLNKTGTVAAEPSNKTGS